MFPTEPTPQAPVEGLLIGPWRVLEHGDSGSFGLIYKVALASDPSAGPFAMKLAATPEDARFEREVELLSLTLSPHLPRFHDAGTWESGGQRYPYIVMQWVEGVPLYQWAQASGRPLTSRRALGLLAQLARALEAVHAHGLHRDVKGDNVRVGLEGHAVLLDVGACWLPDGRRLTVGALPPGTPAYRSPEALAFRERSYQRPGAHPPYQARPQDDVYALGVTAYRLVTGLYPAGPGGAGRSLKPSALVTVAPALEALILRMLSSEWTARGTAAELVQALETAAAAPHRCLDKPVLPSPSVLPTEPTRFRGQWAWRARRLAHAGLTLVGVAAALALLVAAPRWGPRQESGGAPDMSLPPIAAAWHVPPAETPDAGVAEETLLSAVRPLRSPSPAYGLSLPMPKAPFSGQKRPPCEARSEKAILGACWVVLKVRPPCGAAGYEHEGKCLRASFDAPREPTSEQP